MGIFDLLEIKNVCLRLFLSKVLKVELFCIEQISLINIFYCVFKKTFKLEFNLMLVMSYKDRLLLQEVI